jgi:hypothetical protein
MIFLRMHGPFELTINEIDKHVKKLLQGFIYLVKLVMLIS